LNEKPPSNVFLLHHTYKFLLFLDEIADISPAFQVKLLRVLEEKEFVPLGDVKKIKADARVISATNKSLIKMVEEQKFRQDLYYRINIVKIQLPALKERMEDIPLLVEHFITKLNTLRGKNIKGIDQEALEGLMNHNFSGNIRELENMIEYAFVLCSKGNIKLKHLPSSIFSNFLNKKKSTENKEQDLYLNDPNIKPESNLSDDIVKKAWRQKILTALENNNYNRKKAADEIGIHKTTLFRKIKKLGIKLPKVDGRSSSSKLLTLE